MEERIAAFFNAQISTEPVQARQLSGGASQETWMIEQGDQKYILRRPPGGVSPEDDARSIGPEKEAMVMAACHAKDICVPDSIHVFAPGEALHPG